VLTSLTIFHIELLCLAMGLALCTNLQVYVLKRVTEIFTVFSFKVALQFFFLLVAKDR
jgi:hypothetical protein